MVVRVSCYTEKAPNTWHHKEHKRQGKPKRQTIANRHTLQTKHQAPSKAGQPKRRMTPTSTAAMHASSTSTSCHNYAQACHYPAGSSPDPYHQCSLMQSTGGLSRTTAQTPPAPVGGTRDPPAWGAQYQEELMDREYRAIGSLSLEIFMMFEDRAQCMPCMCL